MTAREATAIATTRTRAAAAGAALLWEQVAAVQASLSGPAWQMELSADAPLPSWLIRLTTGHIGHAVDVPAPTLFRTAGLGTAWTNTPRGRLEFHARHHRHLPDASARVVRLLHGVEELGGVTDADVYVHGDGHPDGVFRAEVHTVFGTFTRLPAVDDLADFSAGFHLSRPAQADAGQVTLAWTPRLQVHA